MDTFACNFEEDLDDVACDSCGHRSSWDEYTVNWGECHACFDFYYLQFLEVRGELHLSPAMPSFDL